MVVDSAYGDNFDAFYTKPVPVDNAASGSSSTESLLKPYFDGSASWFTYVWRESDQRAVC